MRFASLFAGVGGFDLGFERAGMECVGQVEIDDHARRVLAHHWPHIPQLGDIHEVSGLDDLGTVDVLCGGFPCQDYSVAGLRGGLAGDRGALWWQFHRLITELRPEWVVGENVPGLLSSNGGRDFGAIVGSLVELGYGVCWRVLDAQYFGVAQRRRRVFIVGHSGGVPRPEVLDLAQGCAWDPPPRREAGKGIAALTANSPGGGGPDDNLAQAGHLIADTLSAGGSPNSNTPGRHREDDTNLVTYLPETTGSLRQTDHKAPKIDIAEPSLIAFNWQSGQDQLSAREHYTDALHAGQTPAVSNGHVRRLTPTECERLQGFPDGWTAGQADTQRYRQMGNAVAVPVVEWLGRRLMEAT